MREWSGKDIRILERAASSPEEIPAAFRISEAAPVRRFHQEMPGYAETPLLAFPALARQLKVRGIYAKDESRRFSLNAFKGLGGSYAMFRILCETAGVNPANCG